MARGGRGLLNSPDQSIPDLTFCTLGHPGPEPGLLHMQNHWHLHCPACLLSRCTCHTCYDTAGRQQSHTLFRQANPPGVHLQLALSSYAGQAAQEDDTCRAHPPWFPIFVPLSALALEQTTCSTQMACSVHCLYIQMTQGTHSHAAFRRCMTGAAGPGSARYEQQEPNVRGEGAFDSPTALSGFMAFLRATGEKLDAQAVLAVVPKAAVAFPRVRGGRRGRGEGYMAQDGRGVRAGRRGRGKGYMAQDGRP